ncbi:hypothetical protein F4803DRAFT_554466 [Xylaria telfairii]|nr:hypothetical protein F4803DRAFT_554466 [Xylaria telfairii]
MTRKTSYQILGVNENSDMPTIKRAWHSLCLQFHPDKAGQTEESHESFVLVQDAYESICKKHEQQNEIVDYSGGTEGAWYQNGSEQKYQAKRKRNNIQYMYHSQATSDAHQLDFDMQFLTRQLESLLVHYAVICPRSEKSTWSVLDKCLRSLQSTCKEVDALKSRILDTPSAIWKQDDPTYAILATLGRLKLKSQRMQDSLRQMEATAQVVEKAPIGSRRAPKRLFRTQAAGWP